MWMEKEKGRRRMKKKREIDEKGACRSIRARRRSRWSLKQLMIQGTSSAQEVRRKEAGN
jgi:hypothetical protein